MKVQHYMILAIAVAAGLLLWPRHEPPIVVEPDPRVTLLMEKAVFDSIRHAEMERIYQRRIDSLDTLRRRVRRASPRVVDSVAGLKPVRTDSLTCVSEEAYRTLVANGLANGQYTLCLGQVRAKDSLALAYRRSFETCVGTVKAMNQERAALKLELERQPNPYAFAGWGLAAAVLSAGLLAWAVR